MVSRGVAEFSRTVRGITSWVRGPQEEQEEQEEQEAEGVDKNQPEALEGNTLVRACKSSGGTYPPDSPSVA